MAWELDQAIGLGPRGFEWGLGAPMHGAPRRGPLVYMEWHLLESGP